MIDDEKKKDNLTNYNMQNKQIDKKTNQFDADETKKNNQLDKKTQHLDNKKAKQRS